MDQPSSPDHSSRPTRIVVGVDGSAGADEALAWALEQAELSGAELEVVVAWDFVAKWAVGFNPEWAEDAEHIGADAVTMGDKAVKRVLGEKARPDWVTVRAEQGSPAFRLVERSRGAALLVVGARGRGGFSTLVLGSVSNACVHHAACPVVVVPTGST